jgi:hypothetical protein
VLQDTRPRRESRPRGRRSRSKLPVLAVYALGVIAVVGLVAGVAAFVRSRAAAVSHEVEMMRAGQEAVRGTLASNVRAAFSDLTETTVEALPDRKWRIAGWVDLIDPFGHATRNDFSLRLYRSTSGLWTPEDIFVTPRI